MIRELSIGDIVNLTPFLRVIKKRFPKAEVECLVANFAREILLYNPNVDKLHINDFYEWYVKGETKFKWSELWKRLKYMKSISRKKYDVAFHLYAGLRISLKLEMLFFQEVFKIGYSYDSPERMTKDNFMYDGVVVVKRDKPMSIPYADFFLKSLENLTGENEKDNLGTEVFTSEKEKLKVEALILSRQWNRAYSWIAIAPTAGNATKAGAMLKTYPQEKMKTVAQKLIQNDAERLIFLLGASSEREYAEVIRAENSRIINLCGELSLLESTELLKNCKLLISNDTGISHIGGALQINQIVIFGPTDDMQFTPYRNPNAVIVKAALPCMPCDDIICRAEQTEKLKKIERPFCMHLVDEAMIVEQAENFLKSQS
ncbi:MAG: hypothetical protein HY22_09220 [[Candidatus Thermochlorobacteriaceae] bacterium GBChlB]|nr:MAG: hypothetical protein HY22_09220 [[Candidatus Thermochlorobacteriaceae] bacterium GBChlB]